jgi:sporadic carbohydrate cluster protein (TIGR04323 family)
LSLLSVTTGIKFGPWRIPQRAQQIIMNEYLKKTGKLSDVMFPEGIFCGHFSRLRMVLEGEKDVTDLIFTSIFQIPENPSGIELFRGFAKKYKFHFALENIFIDKREDLDVVLDELQVARKLPVINNYSMADLFSQMKSENLTRNLREVISGRD